MGKQNVHIYGFHGGQVDKPTLARIDIDKMRLAAEVQENLLCTVTGHGFFRPGTQYLGTALDNTESYLFAFIRARTAASLLEFSANRMRVWNDGVPVTRATVGATLTSGSFEATTGWSLVTTGTATATISGGNLNLKAVSVGSRAIARQEVTTTSAGEVHALRIVVTRGPVQFRLGTVSNGDDILGEQTLRTGTHSIAFVPPGSTFWVQLETSDQVTRIVASCQIEEAGPMILPVPYSAEDLPKLRGAQSLDVLFLACEGYQPRRLERRSGLSWSVVLYGPDDGPFTALPTAKLVKMKPSGYAGNVTLTSSRAFFKPEHVGALFKLTHSGQRGSIALSGDDVYTRPIRVTGVSNNNDDRNWTWNTSGTWAGSFAVERSYDGADVGFRTFGSAITSNPGAVQDVADNDDNAVIYYRLGFKDGAYTSGAPTVTWDYDGGSDYGICRVTGYTDNRNVSVEVLRPFAGTTYTSDWQEGEWSDYQGWPTSVAFYDGRLWWSANDRIWGSISDAYDSFDETTEGDSGPIQRAIAVGYGARTNWIMSLQRLVFGTDSCEASCRSSSLDEPLTPTNLTIRTASTVGSAQVDPVQVDGNGLFIDTGGKRVFEMVFDASANDLVSTEISALVRNLFSSRVTEIAVQRRPDTRVYFVLEDGTCVCLVYFPAQTVAAFIPLRTEGAFISVEVLPGDEQDDVYFVVRRTIGTTVKHFVERMAKDSEITPGTLCKVMDAHISGTNTPANNVINVGTYLAGATVVVWADGNAVPDSYVVNNAGQVTLPLSVTNWCAGIGYRWRYKSPRLAYAASGGTALLQPKRIDHIGILATDFHRDGIKYGPQFDGARPLDPLPTRENEVTAGKVYNGAIYDEISMPFPGTFDTDSRVCLEGQSPYPVKLLGLVITMSTNDRM